MNKTINLDIPRTAEERIAKEAQSIVGFIKRIEAKASDGRYYAFEDADREIVIKFLKQFASGYADIGIFASSAACGNSELPNNDVNDFWARGEHLDGVTR